MQVSTENWLLVHSTKQEQLARARAVDFRVAFEHAIEDTKRLDRLTQLHRSGLYSQEYLQLFATLFERIKEHKLRSRCAPLLWLTASDDTVEPRMGARLAHNAAKAAEDTKLLPAELRLGLAVHAGIQCESARVELVRAKIAACGTTPELQLCAAKHAVAIDEQIVATQSFVRHLCAYAHWGRAAAVCAWFPTRFVTTGLPEWMAEVIADNAEIHKQPVATAEFKSWDAVADAIKMEQSEVPYAAIVSGKSPVLGDDAFAMSGL